MIEEEPPTGKARPTATRLRTEAIRRKQWVEELEPQFRKAVAEMHAVLALPRWRETAPAHMLKLKPLVDRLHDKIQRGLEAQRAAERKEQERAQRGSARSRK
jgi:hypothetical protein